MKLSKRLLTVASMIEPNKTVYDVGCDHGLLSIYLEKEKNCDCIAIDKQKKCIEKTLENKKQFSSKISVLQNDGLTNIQIEENSCILILGMGGRTIQNILETIPKIPTTTQFYVQVNRDLPIFRKWLSKHNFLITEEKLVDEKNQYHVIIVFQRGKGKHSYHDFLLGPILRKKPKDQTNSYYKKELEKIEKRMYDSKKIYHKLSFFIQTRYLKHQLH